MMSMLLFIVSMLAGLWIGSAINKSTPVSSPASQPKRFGLKQAESVAAQLGGLNPSQALAAKVAAVVCEMEFTVEADINAEREELARRSTAERATIARAEQQIEAARAQIRELVGRDGEVAGLLNAFTAKS